MVGEPPAGQDLAWLELIQEARKTSLRSLEETAKQIVGALPILSGLYAVLLGFAKISPAYWQANQYARYIFVAPILFWLLSLIAAIASLFPQAYDYNPNSPDEARNTYTSVISTKHSRLKVA